MDALLPSSEVISEVSQLMVAGFLVGYGLSIAFWVMGYAVAGVLGLLKGGS